MKILGQDRDVLFDTHGNTICFDEEINDVVGFLGFNFYGVYASGLKVLLGTYDDEDECFKVIGAMKLAVEKGKKVFEMPDFSNYVLTGFVGKNSDFIKKLRGIELRD